MTHPQKRFRQQSIRCVCLFGRAAFESGSLVEVFHGFSESLPAFFYFSHGARLSPLRPLFGLLYQPHMIDDDDCEAIGEIRIGTGSRSTRRKPAPVPLCTPQIPSDQARAAAVGSLPVNRWEYFYKATILPSESFLIHYLLNVLQFDAMQSEILPATWSSHRDAHGSVLAFLFHEGRISATVNTNCFISCCEYQRPTNCCCMLSFVSNTPTSNYTFFWFPFLVLECRVVLYNTKKSALS
jgi:hypothetical protein